MRWWEKLEINKRKTITIFLLVRHREGMEWVSPGARAARWELRPSCQWCPPQSRRWGEIPWIPCFCLPSSFPCLPLAEATGHMHLEDIFCSVGSLMYKAKGQGARMDLRVNWELTGPPTQAQGQMRRGRQNSERTQRKEWILPRGNHGRLSRRYISWNGPQRMEKISSTKLGVGDEEALSTLNCSWR